MIHFPRLLTLRLDVQLRELTIAQAVQLAALPPSRHELATTAMLRMVIEEARGLRTDPQAWTVQERTLVKSHFLSCMNASGGELQLGTLKLSDLIMPDVDTAPDSIELGEVCGSRWVLRQVNGAEAEAIETMCRTRFDWIAADMAARLRVVGDPGDDAAPDALAEPARYLEWLAERVATFKAMPQSDFAALVLAYDDGLLDLEHLFSLSLDDAGYVVLPVKGGDASGASARFPVDSAICDLAHALGARPA